MPFRISRAAVLGAGTMGAQIAAHLANAGIPTTVLDVSLDAARQGIERLKKLSPAPLFLPGNIDLLTPGTLDDLTTLAGVDWIIEAVVERLDVKQTLMARVDEIRAPHAIVSSNTSGIPIATIAEGRSAGFRAHWLGTHFFNPPRYLRLVELIATPDTDPAVVAFIQAFLERRLGKAVVPAPDTPAFIANHLGVHGIVRILDAVSSGRWTIEEVDAITGPAIGRPKSATFRTVDLAGLDILAKVASDMGLTLPPLVDRMLAANRLGDKTAGGFYKKVKTPDGSKILTLDLDTLEYREPQKPQIPSLAAAKNLDDLGARLRMLVKAEDKAGDLLREVVLPELDYASTRWPIADRQSSIADSRSPVADDVDRAMREGFGWSLGPFEMRRALAGEDVARPTFLSKSPVVKGNAGASLRDLGDGVLCVEFHSKMNTIGGDTIAMLHAGVAEAAANFQALIVGNDAQHFCAGANLMLVLMSAQEGEWDDIDQMVRAFQGAVMALRLSPVPVVVAPAGLALGGGCEISLHADRVQAHVETYMGLVEVGVGLLPAGGGTKEMLARTGNAQKAFETIGFAKTSTSGPEARAIGYLRDVDAFTMNRDDLLADAKAAALERVRTGYVPPVMRSAIPVGGPDTYATLSLGVHLAWRAGRISDHDAVIGRKIARVLSGGDIPASGTATEQQLLDLEREAFLSLCGEPKTLERIAHTLKTGKPLRN